MVNKQTTKQQKQKAARVFKLCPLTAAVRLALTGVIAGTLSQSVYAELPVAAKNWVGSGAASKVITGNRMDITQTSNKAVLNWQKFNIGVNNHVSFAQPGSSSAALNRIGQSDPSRILGKLTANGQIYLINQNGFIFGKNSVINVNSLIASTHDISNEVFERGMTGVFSDTGESAFDRVEIVLHDEYLISNLDDLHSYISEKYIKDKGIEDAVLDDAISITDSSITIDTTDNADLKSALNELNTELDEKGFIVNVDAGQNKFTFNTDSKGRILRQPPQFDQLEKILIEQGAKVTVGDKGNVLLVAPEIENHGRIETKGVLGQIMLVASQDKVYLQQADSDDFTGILVEVDTGGKVSNFGDLVTKQGGITMAGFVVNQKGRVNATTSVSVNGSIRLQAREGHQKKGDFLDGVSTTRATESDDGLGTEAKVIFGAGSETNIVADANSSLSVDGQEQVTSYLDVAAHTIKLETGSKIKLTSGAVNMTATDNYANPAQGGAGRITVEAGSIIDVSGEENVQVAMERNIGVIDARSSFVLRDSPNQKKGILFGEEALLVDLRKQTEIIDVEGARNRIERTVNERMTQGGEINLTASGEVVVKNGALIDISGGSVDYQSGVLTTTQLLNEARKRFDISDADLNDTFDTLYDQDVLVPGYQEGYDAGALKINTASLDWQGSLNAGVVNGRFQRTQDKMARGGEVNIDLSSDFKSTQSFEFRNNNAMTRMAMSGVQDFVLKTLGDVRIVQNTTLNLNPFSDFSVEGGSIVHQGKIYSAGGKIRLVGTLNKTFGAEGDVTLTKGSVLDSSGRWVNDWLTEKKGQLSTETVVINGGEISVIAAGDIVTERGSAILADGGAQLLVDTDFVEGKGGDIKLLANTEYNFEKDETATITDQQGLVHLGATLSAAGLSENGSLSIASKAFVIGNKTHTDDVNKINYLAAADAIFSNFSDIKLSANNGDIELLNNARINLRQQNRQLNNDSFVNSSRASIKGLSQASILPVKFRAASHLSLSASNDVLMAQGSSIRAENESIIKLTADNTIYVDGLISAPAGEIALQQNAGLNEDFDASRAIWLGQHASLLAQGAVELDPLSEFRSGSVLNGGKISLTADRGYVVIEQGAQLNVSGTATTLDIPINGSPRLGVKKTRIGSDAGEIKIVAAEGIALEGSLKGVGGASSNRNGSLHLELNRGKRGLGVSSTNFLFTPLDFAFKQEADNNFSRAYQFGDLLADALSDETIISADNIHSGGFDYLTFRTPDNIKFKEDVSLSSGVALKLDAANLQWDAATSGRVNLSATYLALGSSRNRTVSATPTLGNGVINFNADWIELYGAMMMDGFEQVNLNSRNDIRAVGIRLSERDFLGELVTAADLNLTAKQIYPSTLSSYSFSVVNNNAGTINVNGLPNNLPAPLSAGGQLTLKAAQIKQAGTLLAPFGHINFDSDSLTFARGSVTSVSGDGLLVPFGIVQIGRDWLYPLDNVENLIINSPPDKAIKINTQDVVQEDGAMINLAGGGDVFAYQFEPGLGGSFDFMDPDSEAYENSFAVLPGIGTLFAPFDHFQTQDQHFSDIAANVYKPGESVFLNGGGGLAAGEYAKFPAHYALLPGAFLVTPVSGSLDQDQQRQTLDGRYVLSGYQTVAGTGKQDSRSSGFLLENRHEVNKKVQFSTFNSSQFFTNKAKENETRVPRLTRDSGLLSILAENSLILDGLFSVDTKPGGLGLRMELASNNIKVVEQLSGQAQVGVLEVSSSDLSDLNIASLVLGAQRSEDENAEGETTLEVNTQNISFEKDVLLDVADLIVAAENSITVKDGATLAAKTKTDTGEKLLKVDGDGALLRVSGSSQVDFNRSGSARTQGELIVEQGARLEAISSMLLDSSLATRIAGDIVMSGGSLNLATNSINIGEVHSLNADTALNLSNASFDQLAVDELILTSRDAINFYGTTGQLDADGVFQQLAGGDISPIGIKRLVFNAAGLRGHAVDADSTNDSVNLKVNELEFKNTLNAIASLPATGAGKLNIEAENLTTGDGIFSVDGFDKLNLTVNQQYLADGAGTLKVAADLAMNAGVMTASSRSDYVIDATGYQAEFNGAAENVESTNKDLAGRLALTADHIALNTAVEIASGRFDINAKNDVLLGSQAKVDLSGLRIAFSDQQEIATAGGKFTVNTELGGISFAEGSIVNLNGAASENGGQLDLHTNSVDANADLQGELSAVGGSVAINVSGYTEQNDLDHLLSKLVDSGANKAISYTSRDQSILLSAETTLTAADVNLTADQGSVTIAGTINAGSANGSKISLNASDEIILLAGAELTARTQNDGVEDNAKGGKVLLATYDTTQGGIDIQSGSLIDVGNANGEKGRVVLRAPRIDSNNDGQDDTLNISRVAGMVTGFNGNGFFAEGVKVYQEADGNINATDITQYRDDSELYMSVANQTAVASFYQGLQLRPGVEVRSTGDLTLNSELNTVDWRYESINPAIEKGVGHFMVRAGGDLILQKNVSDGFKEIPPPFGFGSSKDKLHNGESWSFSLVSGANLASANQTSTVAGTGDISLDSNVMVRTGTGDIGLYAGGDINYTDQTSVVYNAGRADRDKPFGNLSDFFVQFLFNAEYPIEGGDINMVAGGNINGAVSSKDLNDWFLRYGDWNAENIENKPTAWGINFANIAFFEQNIASFGGGNVNVVSGGDVTDLSIMMPTTGKQQGTPGDTFGKFKTNIVEINGGGNLSVIAGGDIAGGSFLVGKGSAALTAGGSITGGSQYQNGPLLATGDTQVSLTAVKDIHLAAVVDPMMLDDGTGSNTNFFSYTADSSVSLRSLAGDIYLNADGNSVQTFADYSSNLGFVEKIYPASLKAAALGGSIKVESNITLFPSAEGDLSLLAKHQITAAKSESASSRWRIGMSDTDTSFLPSLLFPLASNNLGDTSTRLSPFNLDKTSLKVLHAKTPLHASDTKPVTIITQQGDIGGVDYYLPKQVFISSGKDISNARIRIQHNDVENLSVIQAARDIKFSSELNPNTGALINPTVTTQPGIEVAGAGEAIAMAGRNVDLGKSRGILTIGSQENPAVSKDAANLTVMAGISQTPTYLNFISSMLDFRTSNAGNSITRGSFFHGLDQLLATSDVALLDSYTLGTKVIPLFFTALKEAGVAEGQGNALGNPMGFSATEALFPGTDWKGSINLFFSRIIGAEGSDINLLAPGGNINVGLSVAVKEEQNDVAEETLPEGIIARDGAINAYLRGNFEVNESRAIAMGGSDILVWSSYGNIDAGRGAKSALSLPAPKVVLNPVTGQFEIEFPAAIDGSGIRTASSNNQGQGDVFLFAPNGVINASEAGIGAKNLFVVAKAFLGADNVDVGGVSVGVATQSSSAAPVTGSSNSTSSVNKSAENSVQGKTGEGDEQDIALGMLSVDVVGFGSDEDDECESADKSVKGDCAG